MMLQYVLRFRRFGKYVSLFEINERRKIYGTVVQNYSANSSALRVQFRELQCCFRHSQFVYVRRNRI